jgi:molybdate transport system substrate-binding protein
MSLHFIVRQQGSPGGLAVFLLAVLALAAPGCGRPREGNRPVLVVAAASSLTGLLDEAADSCLRATGVRIECDFGSSGSLARRIEAGAPDCVFISADRRWIDYLAGKGLLDSPGARVIARNSLVCVEPAGAPPGLAGPQDLCRLSRIGVGDPEHVPAGAYACQALESLGLRARLETENRLVLGQDVRAVLFRVERGETEAGIVYGSDAFMNSRVRVAFTFPDSTHEPVEYLAAVVARCADPAAARNFLEFAAGAQFRSILARHGFLLP